jgi:hypothetical protein
MAYWSNRTHPLASVNKMLLAFLPIVYGGFHSPIAQDGISGTSWLSEPKMLLIFPFMEKVYELLG